MALSFSRGSRGKVVDMANDLELHVASMKNARRGFAAAAPPRHSRIKGKRASVRLCTVRYRPFPHRVRSRAIPSVSSDGTKAHTCETPGASDGTKTHTCETDGVQVTRVNCSTWRGGGRGCRTGRRVGRCCRGGDPKTHEPPGVQDFVLH